MGTLNPITDGDEERTDLSRLIRRLDPDEAKAWEKYHDLRSRLVKFFRWNQSAFAEELADEVLDRIARKPAEEEIRNLTEFVIGVARNVLREGYKKSQRESHFEDWEGGADSLAEPGDREEEIVSGLDHQVRLEVLRHCLENLRPEERSLSIDYYSASEEKQKVHRQKLAAAVGVTMTALRVRANRVRDRLEDCVNNGLQNRRVQATQQRT